MLRLKNRSSTAGKVHDSGAPLDERITPGNELNHTNFSHSLRDKLSCALIIALLTCSAYSSIKQMYNPTMRKVHVPATPGPHIFLIEYGDISGDGLPDKIQYWTSGDVTILVRTSDDSMYTTQRLTDILLP